MGVIVGVIVALVLVDTLNRWLRPEDYQIARQRRDWRASGRDW